MSLDDLRKQASSQTLLDEAPESVPAQPYRERRFLGLTAFQRFLISIMLLVIVCVVGVFFLLVTQRVVLPYLN